MSSLGMSCPTLNPPCCVRNRPVVYLESESVFQLLIFIITTKTLLMYVIKSAFQRM